MDIVNMIVALFSNIYFYVALVAMGLTGIGMRYLRKVNLNKKKVLLIGALGFLFASGLFSLAMFGVGSVGGGSSSGVHISQLQTTTAYVAGATTALGLATDAGTDDTKMSDFYVYETNVTGDAAAIQNGVFLVTRSGDLPAASCPVRVLKPASYDISDVTYRIVVQDQDTGVMTAYVHTGSSSAAASPSDPKETNQLAFAEGVSQGYISYNITIDETGFDPLTQYDYKDIVTDNCGYQYVFRIHKADA